MLVVRKEGKAHNQYNSFRSAFELLESVGREPSDSFDFKNEDLPPLQKLEQQQVLMQQEQARIQQRVDDLLSVTQDLRSRLEKLE